MTRDDFGGIPEELLRAARAAAAPGLKPAALRERFGPPAAWRIVPGQMWRAAGDDVTMLVLIVSVSGEDVTVAPATVDPAGEDADCLIMDPSRSALGEPVTIWAGLARPVRLETLDRPIDDLGADIAAWCVARSGMPIGCRPGAAAVSPFDMDVEVRAMVSDDIDALAAADGWATALGTATDAAPAAPAPVPSREQLMQLQARLGVPLPDVLALVDGKRPAISDEETAALREVLGRLPHVEPPARGLVIELSHPRWRPAARAFARRTGRSEPKARQAMAYEIAGASMAARQTGEREPAWRDRVQRWVTVQGLEDADR